MEEIPGRVRLAVAPHLNRFLCLVLVSRFTHHHPHHVSPFPKASSIGSHPFSRPTPASPSPIASSDPLSSPLLPPPPTAAALPLLQRVEPSRLHSTSVPAVSLPSSDAASSPLPILHRV